MNGGVRVEHATCGCVSKGAGAGTKWSAHSKMGTNTPGLVPSVDDTIPFISREGGEASRLAHNQDKVSSILIPATFYGLEA